MLQDSVRSDLRGRVLVVDDDSASAVLWSRCLEREGYDARPVWDPHEAISVARTFQPHVAILDLHLGDLHGHTLGLELRRLFPALRLIAVTADSRIATDTQSQALGFAAHLVKPVGVTELVRVVQLVTLPSVRGA